MNGEGMDCHIKISLVNSWWGFSASCYVFQMLFSAWCVKNAYDVQGRKAFLEKSANYAIVNACLFGFVRAIDGYLRFFSGDNSGNNLLIAIVHALGGWIFWGVLSAQVSEICLWALGEA